MITAYTVGRLIPNNPNGTTIRVPITLNWDETIPVEVVFTFHNDTRLGAGPREIPWMISRDLLADGCLAVDKVGEGDVMFEPDLFGGLTLTLSSPSGFAKFQLDLEDLADFLQATENAHPLHLDCPEATIDAALQRLLEAA